MERSVLYDLHNHTLYSHDSKTLPEELCRTAVSNGLRGIALTDHCDIGFCETMDVVSPVLRSAQAANELKGSFASQLTVLAGVELGEAIWYPEVAERVRNGAEYDVILSSVHAVRSRISRTVYSRLDFSLFSEEQIREYLYDYFTDVLENVQRQDFDILPHLTCPLRYICGKYGRKVDLSPYADLVDEILNTVIQRQIALEVNTSGLDTSFSELFPNVSILRRYFDLGGRILTFGSDAHTSDRTGYGFARLTAILDEIGFSEAYYFQKRKRTPYSWKV